MVMTQSIAFFACITVLLFSFQSVQGQEKAVDTMKTTNPNEDSREDGVKNHVQTATFAGGCFWCMVKPFDQYEGVINVVSGYTLGSNPKSEKDESNEAVQITFDDRKISYEQLLKIYWRLIDPTDDGGQFADRGNSYRTAIFYHTESQRIAAENSKNALEKEKRFSKPIRTRILPYRDFKAAQDWHQDFSRKNPVRYDQFFYASGRPEFQKKYWDTKPMNEKELKKRLTDLQFQVTQKNGTESAFRNEYWDNHDEGIYVDIVDGTPLFSSLDKFDSGCGWPSFGKPLIDTSLHKKTDYTHNMKRIEVRSAKANSHLGHVFNDGPKKFDGRRYCINSAALRFIPKEKLVEEGYGEYLKLFEKSDDK